MHEGQRIIHRLLKAGYTQRELANHLNVYEPELSTYKHGTRVMRDDKLSRLKALEGEYDQGILPEAKRHALKKGTYQSSEVIETPVVSIVNKDNINRYVIELAQYDGCQQAIHFVKTLGVPQQDLANMIHTSAQKISDCMAGRRGLSEKTAVNLYQFIENVVPSILPFGLSERKNEVMKTLEQYILAL